MVPLTKELTPISPSTSREFGFVTKDGIYQRMTLLYGSLAAFVMAANNMMPLVASPGVNHWCAPPDGVQVSEEDWKNMSIPVDEDGKYSQCQMLNGTDNSSVVACTKWQYESSRHFGTIVEEWNLVCDRAWFVPATTVVYLFGTIVGFIISGILSDSIGRMPVAMVSCIAVIVFCISIGNAANIALYIVLRFFVASAVSALTLPLYVLLIEVVAVSNRGLYGIIIAGGYAAGTASVHVAQSVNIGWRLFQLLLMVPTTTLVLGLPWIQESPRWLISRWNLSKAENVVLTIGRINGTKPERTMELWRSIRLDLEKEEEKYSEMLRVELLSVLLAPSLRRTNVILFYSWFTVSLTYYGIHVYMMMNPSTTMMVTLLTFLPIAMLTYCGMECLGRTRTLTCAMFLSTFSCLLDVFFRGDEGSAVSAALTDTLEVLGITVAQTVVVLVIAEVNPTAVRTIAVCCGFVCSRSGMICAALAQHLWTLPSVGPPVLYGVFCLVAGILVTFVPETKAARLPEAVKKFNMFEIAPLPLGRKSHRRKAEARSPRHSPVHVARRSLEPVLSKLVEIYGSETTTLSSYGISDVLLDIRDVIQKSSDTNHSAL
ncbi:solute carrier family 22 member 3-like isoform X1 [Ornithodoros turicata]|uniref:solute carrier family 22 member 3-like isoform X1 n=1 Tax=Ornithodoros turicata TaxID=34597 RepID=UPI003139A817